MSVAIEVEGINYTGWKTASVRRSLFEFPSSFQMSITEDYPSGGVPFQIEPLQECRVYVGGDLVSRGFIDAIEIDTDASRREIQVSGRSRACDLRDCSAIVEGGQIRGRKLEEIARQLAEPFGISVETEVDTGEPVADLQIQQGETVYEIVERIARTREILVADTVEGNLLLTRSGLGPESPMVEQGKTIKAFSTSLSVADRFSEYTVKGQQPSTDQVNGRASRAVQGAATDTGVNRHRPLIVLAEGQVDGGGSRCRAVWEARHRLQSGTRVDLTMVGWHDCDGRLWQPNMRLPVRIPYARLDREMVVHSVDYRIGEQGQITDLELGLPETFGDQAAAVTADRSGPVWGGRAT